jgi:hypothetical protein
MPKLRGMAQLSRPFQIALLALGVFVLAWFAVLHRPGGSSTSSSSPSASSSSSSSSPSSSPSSSGSSPTTSAAHSGSALGGFSRDIQRAHGAAAQVEGNGREVQSKAAESPGEATSGGGVAVNGGSAAVSSTSRAATGTAHHTAHTRAGSAAVALSKQASNRPGAGQQAMIAGELKQGKVVLLLFWNPHSADDAAVDGQVQAAAHELGRRVAVHTARAGQVDSFGSITRDIQIYQTPTLLIVNPARQVTTVTGYTDAFAIEQAVAEARK